MAPDYTGNRATSLQEDRAQGCYQKTDYSSFVRVSLQRTQPLLLRVVAYVTASYKVRVSSPRMKRKGKYYRTYYIETKVG